jgi:hypothetical protein
MLAGLAEAHPPGDDSMERIGLNMMGFTEVLVAPNGEEEEGGGRKKAKRCRVWRVGMIGSEAPKPWAKRDQAVEEGSWREETANHRR